MIVLTIHRSPEGARGYVTQWRRGARYGDHLLSFTVAAEPLEPGRVVLRRVLSAVSLELDELEARAGAGGEGPGAPPAS